MKLGSKMLIAFLLISLIPFISVCVIALVKSSNALSKQAFSHLESVREVKKGQIENFWAERFGNVLVLSKSTTIVTGLSRFAGAFRADDGKVGGAPYLYAQLKYGNAMERFVNQYKFDDLYLADKEGNIVFSVAHKPDEGQNVRTGKLKNSPLSKCFQNSMGGVFFQDFKPYAICDNRCFAFLGAPVTDEFRNEFLGVVILSLTPAPINKIMLERSGMGETGETYLVGSDMLMRSDTFLDSVNHSVKAPFINAEKRKIDTQASREAISGKSGRKIITSYAGKEVLSAYSPVRVGDMKWALIAETESSEAFEAVNSLLITTCAVAIVSVLIIFFVSFLFARSIVHPVTYLRDAMQQMRTGELGGHVRIRSRDEIGDLAESFNEMSKDRKLAEEALRESEERYRRLTENARDMIYRMSLPDGRYEYVSPASVDLFGYAPSEFYDSPMLIQKAIHPDWQQYFEERWGRLVVGDMPPSYEYQIIHKSGETRWLYQRNVLVSDDGGRSIAIEGIVTDDTERKLTEEELRHLRNYLSNIINSMPSMLIGVDTKSKVTQWNKTAEQTTGISASVAQGKTLSDVLPRMASEMGKITESIRTRETRQGRKMPSISENGETRYEDVTVYPLVVNGAEGAVIRIDDVTDKVRMEEMVVQNEKMLSVGGLAAGMAHEINNPLAGMIQTAANMANRLTNADIPANMRAAEAAGVSMESIRAFMESRGIPRMIGTINESGRRVADIVDNMLSFARKGDASVSSHDMAGLLDRTLELAATDYDLKKQYDFKTIGIMREYEDNLPYVPCEGAKIQQVLLNILRNGAQAMQEAREDEKNKPRFILRLAKETETGMLRVEIADNGPGMDEATRKRIFEPFFTTKPMGEGTGLGLSVSYFIITENHGGEMSVESSPGKGTKFIIKLPVKKEIKRDFGENR
ncbi:PAS domain S-box protein [Desulfococcaceae bacterium HSG8]|nr:PAS domain S-box protein [Desulfococcaceae bacterium HSG8]